MFTRDSRVTKSLRLAVVAVVIGLMPGVPAGVAHAETASRVIFHDTFDAEPLGLSATTLANWTVTSNVDVIGPGLFDLYPGNGRYLDLDGSCGAATIRSRDIALSAGVYQLSFELGSNPHGEGHDNGLRVELGALYGESFSPSPPELIPISREITVATPTVAGLLFRETDTTDCGGTVIDDVSLVLTNPPAADVILDGTIWYSRKLNATTQGTIWRASAAEDVQVTSGDWPVLSPDGNSIVFHRDQANPGRANTYVRDLQTGAERRIFSNNDWQVGYDWMPDSQKVVLDYFCSIYTINRDGSGFTNLLAGADCFDDSPAVSPSGTTIAFHNARVGTICFFNRDGRGRRCVGAASPNAWWPRWSPDSEWVSFVKGGNVFRMRPDGTGLTQLTSLTSPDGWTVAPVQWTSDGSGLVGAATIGGVKGVYRVPSSGGAPVLVQTSPGAGAEFVGSVTGVVRINHPPVPAGDLAATQEDTPVTIDVLGNDTDADGDKLYVGLAQAPTAGEVVVEPDGRITYMPGANFHGDDQFQYEVSDGTAAASATVTVEVEPVGDRPRAVDDHVRAVEDTQLSVDVRANDASPDGGPLTASLRQPPTKGSAKFDDDGLLVYTPNEDASGPDSLTYAVTNGDLTSDEAAVTIEIEAVNDAPSAADDLAVTTEDTPVEIDVMGNDRDPEGPISPELAGEPAHGSAELLESGRFRYRPAADFYGTDQFTYRATDGELRSEPVRVAVTVERQSDDLMLDPEEFPPTEAPLPPAPTVGSVVGTAGDLVGGTPLGEALGPALDAAEMLGKVLDGGIATGTGTTSTVFSWGSNSNGQLGDGTRTDRALPGAVLGLTNVKDVDGGGAHAVALTEDGRVYAWGANQDGQVGDGTTTSRSAPVPVRINGLPIIDAVDVEAAQNATYAVRGDGTVWAWGRQHPSGYVAQPNPTQVAGLTGIKVTQVSSYNWHVLALDDDGHVWSWGENYHGQLGRAAVPYDAVPQKVTVGRFSEGGFVRLKVKSVATGYAHSLALTDTGVVFSWGRNADAELGWGVYNSIEGPNDQPFPAFDGSGELDGIVAISAGSTWNLAVDQAGHVLEWGWQHGISARNPTPAVKAGIGDVVRVANGSNWAYALRADATVWAWGSNGGGQLGDGTTTWRNTPQPVLFPGGKPVAGIARSNFGSAYAWTNAAAATGHGPALTYELRTKLGSAGEQRRQLLFNVPVQVDLDCPTVTLQCPTSPADVTVELRLEAKPNASRATLDPTGITLKIDRITGGAQQPTSPDPLLKARIEVVLTPDVGNPTTKYHAGYDASAAGAPTTFIAKASFAPGSGDVSATVDTTGAQSTLKLLAEIENRTDPVKASLTLTPVPTTLELIGSAGSVTLKATSNPAAASAFNLVGTIDSGAKTVTAWLTLSPIPTNFEISGKDGSVTLWASTTTTVDVALNAGAPFQLKGKLTNTQFAPKTVRQINGQFVLVTNPITVTYANSTVAFSSPIAVPSLELGLGFGRPPKYASEEPTRAPTLQTGDDYVRLDRWVSDQSGVAARVTNLATATIVTTGGKLDVDLTHQAGPLRFDVDDDKQDIHVEGYVKTAPANIDLHYDPKAQHIEYSDNVAGTAIDEIVADVKVPGGLDRTLPLSLVKALRLEIRQIPSGVTLDLTSNNTSTTTQTSSKTVKTERSALTATATKAIGEVLVFLSDGRSQADLQTKAGLPLNSAAALIVVDDQAKAQPAVFAAYLRFTDFLKFGLSQVATTTTETSVGFSGTTVTTTTEQSDTTLEFGTTTSKVLKLHQIGMPGRAVALEHTSMTLDLLLAGTTTLRSLTETEPSTVAGTCRRQMTSLLSLTAPGPSQRLSVDVSGGCKEKGAHQNVSFGTPLPARLVMCASSNDSQARTTPPQCGIAGRASLPLALRLGASQETTFNLFDCQQSPKDDNCATPRSDGRIEYAEYRKKEPVPGTSIMEGYKFVAIRDLKLTFLAVDVYAPGGGLNVQASTDAAPVGGNTAAAVEGGNIDVKAEDGPALDVILPYGFRALDRDLLFSPPNPFPVSSSGSATCMPDTHVYAADGPGFTFDAAGAVCNQNSPALSRSSGQGPPSWAFKEV